MRNRYTMKQLKEFSDYKLLEWIVIERMSTLTNRFSPTSRRLGKLARKLERKEELTR